jgi:hypothetical protein
MVYTKTNYYERRPSQHPDNNSLEIFSLSEGRRTHIALQSSETLKQDSVTISTHVDACKRKERSRNKDSVPYGSRVVRVIPRVILIRFSFHKVEGWGHPSLQTTQSRLITPLRTLPAFAMLCA